MESGIIFALAALLLVSGWAAAAQTIEEGASTPSSCSISPSSVSLQVMGSAGLSVSCFSSSAEISCPQMQWSSTIGGFTSSSLQQAQWSAILGAMLSQSGSATGTSATFSAGTAAGSGTIYVRSADSSISCSIPVAVLPGSPYSLKVSPASSSLNVGGSQQFSARLYDQYGNVITSADRAVSFAWQASPGIGTVSQSGLFTASAEGKGQVSATYTGTPSRSITGSAEITVSGPAPAKKYCLISPSPSSVMVAQQQSFSITCYDRDPRMMEIRGARQVPCPAVLWSATDGEITRGSSRSAAVPSATFTAGKYAKEVTIRADEDSPLECASCTMSCSAIVQVTPGPASRVSVSPSTASVYVGDSQQFTATASDQYGNTIPGAEFSWNADGNAGKVDRDGVFSASGAGSSTVRAETVGPSLTQPFGTASVSASARSTGGSGGSSGGSGSSNGGGSFASSSTVSYTCAGAPATLNVWIFKPGASALAEIYYTGVRPSEKVLSKYVTSNQTVSFIPGKIGGYEIRVTVDVDQRSAGFDVPECTPATVNITKNVTIELKEPEKQKNVTITPPKKGNEVPIGPLPPKTQEEMKILGIPVLYIVAAGVVIALIISAVFLFGGKKSE